MLPVVVGLEQREAEVELEGDAADAPDVAWLAPAQLEDDLGGAVVPGAHHLAVVLPVEGCGPEVDEPHLGALHLPHVLPLQGRRSVSRLPINGQLIAASYLHPLFLKHWKVK